MPSARFAQSRQKTAPQAAKQPPKVGFVSLGCPKALVDSERILTQLRAEGYVTSAGYAEADVVIVNTCGFIDSAVQESLDAIGEAMNENGKVIVTGCLGAKKEVIQEKYPDVLSISGPQDYASVMTAVHSVIQPKHDPFLDLLPAQGIKLTPKHYAYLKISEGCNHACSFCIIPSMRGKLVSRPIAQVLIEAEKLAKAGVHELLVISQDTSAYGVDTRYAKGTWRGVDYRTHIQDLAIALGELGIWVRMHYVYPYPHVDDLIPLMAEGKILPYLDIPFQHGSPSVLKRMKRPAHAENTLARIAKWRSICPDIAIRSTFVVGFPGETEEEFQELLAWLEEAQLDRVGCFTYSPVEGASANDLADPVPPDIQQDRYHRFMQAQSRISAVKMQAKVGKVLEVLIDSLDKGIALGRTTADAPEIDGHVAVTGYTGKVGAKVTVRITEASTYDLRGVVV
jgi:ribosomal protein S12 methylthiotransferase